MASQTYKLAVIIVNYRTPEVLISCLGSLLPELGEDAVTVVVDNASGDRSLEMLRVWLSADGRHSRVQLLPLQVNRGFSAGNNHGVRSVRAEFYLLLNSDTIVRPGAVAALISVASREPRAGIIGPRLEWPDGQPQESCFRDQTPMSELIAAARTGPITSLLKRFDVPLAVGEVMPRPAWVSFACVLIRAETLRQAGLLDEGFFMYFEDAEFCHRARQAGWLCAYAPEARVVHLRGGSSEVKRLASAARRLPRYYYDSRSRYFFLLYGRAGLTAANFCWMAGRVISKLRELISMRSSHVPIGQWRDIWCNWRCPLACDQND